MTRARPRTKRRALALEPLDRDLVVPRVGDLSRIRRATGAQSGVTIGRPGHAGDAPPLGQQVGGAHHHLGGDAAPVRALAADELGLDADDVETRLGQVLRDLLPPGAEADDDGIDLHGIYRPPQLVIWTGATMGVPTSSWIW